MKISLLIIGNEILEGKTTDANTRQLAQFLNSINLELSMVITVKDEEAHIHQGLSVLFEQSDVVVTSGGLGPTPDDVTKATLATWLERKVEYSGSAQKVAEDNYKRFNREFPGKEHGYCYLPEGFLALNNSTGFAPGLFGKHDRKFILCGPGVPREFKSLLDDHFVNLIMPHFPQSSDQIELYTVRTRKIPEEKIFGEVDPGLWEKLSAYGNVSSLPTILGVDIGVKLFAKNVSQLEEKKKAVTDIFNSSPLRPNIWQFGRKTLEEVIVEKASDKNLTFGFAESCTGGLCSHRVTGVSGSSKCFLGSVVCYDESVKEKSLGVERNTLDTFGAVSKEAAEQMASRLVQNLGVKIGVSITGFAGPSGGTVDNPVGTAFVGICNGGITTVHHFKFTGDREQLKIRFSQAALFILLEELEKSA